jgi:glycosyltransferase involved in cell wall biosynthesis
MADLLVSVVIPSIRDKDVIQRAINSIREQSYSPIEVIIVSEGQFKSANLFSSEGIQSITLTQNEKSGVSGARNTGIQEASGEFIAFLDDDDQCHDTKIERQVNILRNSSNKVLGSYCWVRQIGKDGSINGLNTPVLEPRDILQRNPIGTFSALMVKSDTVDQIGLLDTNLHTWEDWDYYIRLFQAGSLAPVREPLVDRISSDNQLSARHDLKNTAANILLRKHLDYAAEFENGTSIFKSGIEFELGRSAIKHRQYTAGRSHLFKSVKNNPRRVDAWLYLALSSGGRFTFRPVQYVKRALI